MANKTDCPKCGNPQSFRIMRDGKPKRQCGRCKHEFTIATGGKLKAVNSDDKE